MDDSGQQPTTHGATGIPMRGLAVLFMTGMPSVDGA